MIALIAALLSQTALPTPVDVIDQYGMLIFTDGSSVYRFLEDGSFLLEPVGMSGRAIEGTWESDGHTFEIEGIWGWYNGISAIDDRRRMEIIVTVLSDKPRETEMLLWSADSLVWDVYFTIDELVTVEDRTSE